MNKRRSIKYLFIFLGIVLIFFAGRSTLLPLSNISGSISSYFLYPLLVIQYKIINPVKEYMHQREIKKNVMNELEQLKDNYEQLQAELIVLKSNEHYYHDIKELIEYKKRYKQGPAEIGHIIFKQFSDAEHFFLVNRGRNHGIVPDMVAVYNNCLVGRVSEVFPWYCKVVAVTDRSCKVAAFCDQTKSCGIHVGANNLNQSLLNRVSHLSTVKDGDLIFSNGEGLIFPSGFGLGRVKEHKKEGLWYDITIEPLISIQELSYCSFLSKSSMS